jgi:DNA polymerase-1
MKCNLILKIPFNMKLFFDIETNGLTDWIHHSDLETVHCMVVIDEDDNVFRYQNDTMDKGLEQLKNADEIIGHNSINFDYMALYKLYAFVHPRILDTMIMSRCIYPDISTNDAQAGRDRSIMGSHSLKAWGFRLGDHKGTFGQSTDWSQWSQEMEDYCVQDVKLTKKLYEHLMSKEPSKQMLELEHDFAKQMKLQERNGFPFDMEKSRKLDQHLGMKRADLREKLEATFEPNVITMKSRWYENSNGDKFPTKKAMLESGYKPEDIREGDFKTKTIPFNPGSRDQIAQRLLDRGWKPDAYEGKRPQINEGVLKSIGTPEADLLLEYLMVSKRLGQVSEGKQAWQDLAYHELGGYRIHGSIITNGTVSGRCSHRKPNVAQVPAVRAPYGAECRELFTAPKGKVLVGCDASGLELRCLAHYLYPWDKGAYAKEILEGDIHSANQKSAGLETRDQAKTFIYAFLYGAGDAKIGSIVGGSSKDGKKLKEQFFRRTPAIKNFLDAVGVAIQTKGSLTGLDGRILPARSAHSAPNLLLQSAGAVIMKQALVEFVNIKDKPPYEMHANVHDEVQFSCLAEHADQLGQNFVDSIKRAGNILKFNCPLDGEYKIGNNWKETH